MIVIVIIGLLSTIALTNLNRTRLQSRDARRTSDIKTIQSALEMYYSKSGGYPVTTEGGCIESGSEVGIEMERDSDVILRLPHDPIWRGFEPALFNDNIKNDYPIGASENYCYWYYGAIDSYYLSYFLETDSKAGEPGIYVQSINN